MLASAPDDARAPRMLADPIVQERPVFPAQAKLNSRRPTERLPRAIPVAALATRAIGRPALQPLELFLLGQVDARDSDARHRGKSFGSARSAPEGTTSRSAGPSTPNFRKRGSKACATWRTRAHRRSGTLPSTIRSDHTSASDDERFFSCSAAGRPIWIQQAR